MSERPRAGSDGGLQPERTSLAWQRTGLAALGIALGITLALPRLAWPAIGAWSALPGLALALAAGLLLVRGSDRYRRLRPDTSPDGVLPLVTAAGLVLLGGVALVVVVSGVIVPQP